MLGFLYRSRIRGLVGDELFLMLNLFSTDETLQASLYAITISVENLQTSYIR